MLELTDDDVTVSQLVIYGGRFEAYTTSIERDRFRAQIKDNIEVICYTILYSLYRVVSWYIIYAV